MGHDKLRKFAENESFACLLQPSAEELLADGYASLHDHQIKGGWAAFFGNDHPIVLELGCGKGEYTIDLAERDPSKNYIGVDIKGARLWKGAKYATENKMGNVAFLRTRIEFITAFFAPGEIAEIWLTFSDPQMKSENSRLSSPLFLDRYRSFLKEDGIVHLKTDSRFLHEYTKSVCCANGLDVLFCTDDLYGSGQKCPDDAVYEVKTFYERMFLEQGYKITYMKFSITHEGEYLHPQDPEQFDSAFWKKEEGPRRSFGHSANALKALLPLLLFAGMTISCGIFKTPASGDMEEEIYSTGYTNIAGRHMTGSASKVVIDEDQVVSYSNIYEYLKGRVSGLLIEGDMSNPEVTIRGKKSIYGSNTPLYIVNGIEVQDIGYLDPNMVASVTVLKDASTTAQYGSRGANGVILIQMK